MITPRVVFLLAVGVLLLLLVGTVVYSVRRQRQVAARSWEVLLGRLQAVNREGITRLALGAIDEALWDFDPLELSQSEIEQMVGGMDGLLVLRANCEVLIEMAAYVQRLHPEAIAVTEQLRLSTRKLEWHISRIQGAKQVGKLDSAFDTYAQSAAAIYYEMTQSVLDLFEAAGLREVDMLRARI